MSTDGESSNRLSAALDQIFSRSTAGDGADDHTEERTADGRDVPEDPYELPEIVPATEEAPATTEAPTLPARAVRPGDEPAARTTAPAAPAAPPAAAPPVAAPGVATAAVGPPAGVTAWGDHLTSVPSNARGAGLRAPGRRPRIRRVTRVLRHIDPWSTFKVALLFSLVTYLVGLTSGVLLWRVAESTGTLDNVERWFTQFGWETFELDGAEIFHNAWIIGLFGAVGMTGGLVLLATVFNLVSDIIGGIRVTVLEEEVVERTISSTRRYVVRQGPAAAGAPAAPVQDWDVDDSDAAADSADSERAERGDPDRTGVVATGMPTVRDDHPATAPVPTADWSVDDD